MQSKHYIKIISAWICCIAPYTCSNEIMPPFDFKKKIQQAEDLFEGNLALEAIPIYEEILQIIKKKQVADTLDPILLDKLDDQVKRRLIQAFFQTKNYQAAIQLLQSQSLASDSQFLLGSAYRSNGDYSSAIHSLKNYINQSNSSTYLDEASLELGLSLFLNGSIDEAKTTLQNLLDSTTKDPLKNMAYLYLARIKINQNHPEEAEKFLNCISHDFSKNESLKYEVSYLKGEIFYKKQQFLNAAHAFENALSSLNLQEKWREDTLYYLGLSYLKLAETTKDKSKQLEYFLNAEKTLKKLTEIKSRDQAWVALGECYLSKAACLQDEQSYKKAHEIFSTSANFTLPESQNLLPLFKAQAQSSYSERDSLFRQLTQASNSENPFYARSWYLRGLNDYKEGERLDLQQKNEEASKLFERANAAFEKVYDKTNDSEYIALALLFQGRVSFAQKNYSKAIAVLNQLWNPRTNFIHFLSDPLEPYIVYAYNAANLSDKPMNETITKLKEGIEQNPYSNRQAEALNLLGTIYYKINDFAKAEELFSSVVEKFPHLSATPDALFWAALSAEKQQKERSIVRNYLEQILSRFPNSPVAPEAYFSLYTYQEYLQGDRIGIKHLETFSKNYPDHPLGLNALFLIGVDNKRDRRSSEGKWIRKKNLTAAIDYFQQVESLFNSLAENKQIPSSKLEHYLLVRYRAHLEKGITNYLLSSESYGAKKHIYLEFAQEILNQLFEDLESESNPYRKWMVHTDSFWYLKEETAHWLAQVYIIANDTQAAENILAKMMEKYRAAKITRGYFLSRLWSTQASIAMEKNDHQLALECLQRSEDAAKGKVLTTDQRLDLWIQQSLCHKELNQLDQALLILSKVVNDDAISSLRIKAMFLRSDIYEKQGRFELARKQLEATSKKGGEWALKAKEKLEKDYGYK